MAGVSRTPKIFGSSYQPPSASRTGSLIGPKWRAIIILILVFGAISLVGRLPIFRLKTVELQGDQDQSISHNLDSLRGQPIFSTPVTNFIDTTRQNLTVDSFDCRRGLPDALRCTLKLHSPALVWQSGGLQYLVDKTGLLYAAKSAEVSPATIVVNDLSLLPIKLGSLVASAEIVSQYQQLVTMLKAQSLTVTSLQLGETLFQVTTMIDRPGKTPVQALFLLSGDINNQIASVVAALSQKGDSITTSVDVRVPGYVYTK